MKKVLVTGSGGFIGKNLVEALRRQRDVALFEFDVGNSVEELRNFLSEAHTVYHLAGVNRPERTEEYETGNAGLTEMIVSSLRDLNKSPAIVMSSSVQAILDNPYGVSKKRAEDALFGYSRTTGAPVYVYRLTNVFGKWSRPHYNSVVSTFCYNISHGVDIYISDPSNEVELVYIDDVIAEFVQILRRDAGEQVFDYLTVTPTFKATLGELARKIYQLRDIRKSLVIPDLSDNFMKRLYATYLSYLEKDDFSYGLDMKTDERGGLAELIKSQHFGQIFVSRTRRGITRGNHYHNTKTEKFCVLQGKAVIRFRHILSDEIFSYHVSGEKLQVVDIPPGYTHSIENLSDEEMIVLFWADQVFDPEKPDTYPCQVIPQKQL